MSVKKLSFYLDSARITVRSDHLPLKRFLEKNTLNAKVNNWAVELESQKIDFVFIQGTKNVLADTLSRLIEIDDDIKLPAEQEGHEFGYVPFEQLPPAQVTVTEEVIINEVNNLKIEIQHIDPVQKDLKIELPISNLKLKELQEQKQLQQGLEWDDLVWKATAAYNFFPTESSGFSPFFLMYGCEANAKHMILAEETTKYLGDNEGVLNVQLMMKLLQVVAYNLAKSRTARDGNRLKRKNFRPRHIKINHPVLVKNHTAKPFEARSNDYICVGFEGNNRILVKDNHGKITKVNRKDVTPIEMDIKIAELFKESRQNSKIRDAQLAMPTSRIPDLDWKFDEDIQLVEPVHEQVYSLEQTQEKEQPITPPPTVAPMEKEGPVQLAEEVTTEAIAVKAAHTPKIEECQTTPQTPIVSRFLSVLKPVAAAVT